jgi:transposase
LKGFITQNLKGTVTSMEKKILHVGLDVDDTAFHGCALLSQEGELIEFRCRPNVDGLVKKFKEISGRAEGREIHVCYEAGYLGFTLQRELAKAGIHCDVIDPGSIPRATGKRLKTDRLDAIKLAGYYANGMLKVVVAPDEETERDRDLLRSRQFVLGQLSELRTHIHGLLRRAGRHYKVEMNAKSHWSRNHLVWLERTAEELEGSLKVNLLLLLSQMKILENTMKEYGQAVDALAVSKRYEKPVQALTCYRGIKNTFAMTMITEIGGIKRFSHPRKLVSWSGLDLREYSSGGTHHRFGITKHGNRFLRTALVEANQRTCRSPNVGKDVLARRRNLPAAYVEIAERCQRRLAKKAYRMTAAGKHTNKVKVACAREMIGFVWESLNLAQAA